MPLQDLLGFSRLRATRRQPKAADAGMAERTDAQGILLAPRQRATALRPRFGLFRPRINLFSVLDNRSRVGSGRDHGKGKPWASGKSQGIKEGETVGLLLRQGSLSVYIKGKEVGVLCTDLSGEFVWAANMGTDVVRIACKPPPGSPKKTRDKLKAPAAPPRPAARAP